MSGFVDLHVHILPGIDDGAQRWEESLEMARAACACGTSMVMATPHLDLDSPRFEPKKVIGLTQEISVRIKEAGIPLTVLPGLEMRMCTALSRTAGSGGDLAPYTLDQNGRYLLFDLPLSEVPLLTLDACFSLRLQGIQPVIAHPERNRELASKGPLLKSFLASGLLVQIDGGSLLGLHGRRARKAAFALLKEKRVHAVASDAHSAGRALDLRQAEGVARTLCGDAYTRAIFNDNPFRMCMGEALSGCA